MSGQWNMPEYVPRPPPPLPSLWIILGVYVVIQALGAAITIITWGARPMDSGDFLIRLLVLPVSLTCGLCGLFYATYARDGNLFGHSWASSLVTRQGVSTLEMKTIVGVALAGIVGGAAITWLWHGTDYVGPSSKAKDAPYVFTRADFFAVKDLPYDSPPQIIYRIDDHRYVTLEKYRDCHYGEAYYNDTKLGLRKKLGRAGVENYQGWIINADPTGRNLAFPMSPPPGAACPERGCRGLLLYSTDAGRTFGAVVYVESTWWPYQTSKEYGVFVTKDKLFVASQSGKNDAYIREYPMLPGINPNGPYPTGVEGDGFRLSRQPGIFDNLTTPSGQNQISCDASIKPTNPDARLIVPDRQRGY
ncbi:hypothetical protein [Pandoraea sp. NPDC090278]|uniref:T6SS immunity protein Tli3 family protein n=1 Tax=Pandoraea sp. NPDC090278 TaxID=3364391 RepID=UPI00383B3299